jgi:stage II sporulation protein E
MVTDGVLEYLHTKEPEAKLCEMIGDIDTDNAGILAKTLMDRVLLITGNYAMDDMTILTLGIWEK